MPWDWQRWVKRRRQIPVAPPGGGEGPPPPPPRFPPIRREAFTGAATQQTFRNYWHPITPATEGWAQSIPAAYRNSTPVTYFNNLPFLELGGLPRAQAWHLYQRAHDFFPPGWPAANIYFNPEPYMTAWLASHPWDADF
jgi:hypothetical protein